MSDLHRLPLKPHDLPEPMAASPSEWPVAVERPRIWSKRSSWSGRLAWHWSMIHPLLPIATVTRGPFWTTGEAMDDARKYLRNRAWS